MQRRLRTFITAYNRRCNATILLTSHYMADVVELCQRVILIHQGKLLYDGALSELSGRLAPFRLVRLTLNQPLESRLPEGTHVIEQSDDSLTLRVDRPRTPAIVAQVLRDLPVVDLTIEDPPIEAVIDQVYQEGIL
jgi:ABC-2 type transport system ATP-binding protein